MVATYAEPTPEDMWTDWPGRNGSMSNAIRGRHLSIRCTLPTVLQSIIAVEGAHPPRRQPLLLLRSGGHSAREAVEPHRRLPRTRN
jgi:hypothetical protein